MRTTLLIRMAISIVVSVTASDLEDATGPHPIRITDGTLLNGGFDDYWSGFVILG